MPIDNKQSDSTDVRRIEDDQEQEFDLSKMKIVVDPTSGGFFSKWEGLSDEAKIELNALAREHFEKIHQENLERSARCSGSFLDWVILRA